MRGKSTRIDAPEWQDPDHPLVAIKTLADDILRRLSSSFTRMYARKGRPSVPPERLLKAMLLIALYSIRSERMLCEQLSSNSSFCWFLDMGAGEAAFNPSTFSHNRRRLLDHGIAAKFFRRVVERARSAGLMSARHFSVDGTLIEAWASMKSFRPKGDKNGDGNAWADFRGRGRSNQTHESKTDPDAQLFRKGPGKEAKLAFMAHVLMENRSGLMADVRISKAGGHAERDEALRMLEASVQARGRVTVGADAGYDARDFVTRCRELQITAHVARKKYSALDARTTRHAGYGMSQTIRKRIEPIFGWLKTVAGLRKTRYRGFERNQLVLYVAAAASNLLRIAKLLALRT